MTCSDTSRCTLALLTLVGLGACAMENPAFEDGQADEVGDSGETRGQESTAGESGESGSSTDDTGTSDSTDTTDTADSLDSNTLDGSDDPIENDLPIEECLATFSDPFTPIWGTPEGFGGACPFAVSQHYVRVLGNGPAIGLLSVQKCSEGCSACDGADMPLGVVGLDEFTTPLVIQAQQNFLCLTVQTGSLRGVDDAGCLYDSLWVGKDDLDLLLGLHRVSQLPPNGQLLMGGNAPPSQGESLTHCACASVYDEGDPDLDCCVNSTDPFVTSLTFLGADVEPGGFANVGFDGGEWSFHVAQSQLLPSCENVNVSVDQSWALIRGQ